MEIISLWNAYLRRAIGSDIGIRFLTRLHAGLVLRGGSQLGLKVYDVIVLLFG